MAGEQRQHISPRLDQYLVDVIWLYDLDGRDLIGQCFPEICDIRFIAYFQKVYIAEIGRAVPSRWAADGMVLSFFSMVLLMMFAFGMMMSSLK